MLNWIWAGFIVFSLAFALFNDTRDLVTDRYRNEAPVAVALAFPDGYDPDARRVPVEVSFDPGNYRDFYGLSADDAAPASPLSGVLIRNQEGRQLRLDEGADLPAPLSDIRDFTNSRTNQLQGVLPGDVRLTPGDTLLATTVTFASVRFVKMVAIGQAALDFAEIAAEIALSLIGVLALFLGLLKIAEEAGLIFSIVRFVQPILRPLFPDVPKDHPAMAMIALNLTANVFGLGNAATPLGIKAMEELQTLNPDPNTATNPMVMLLAMNTASVQLVPPVLLLALMGLQINQLIFAILIATGISLTVAILATKLLGKLDRYKSTDPNRLEGPPPAPPPTS